MGAVLCVKLDKIIINLHPVNYTHDYELRKCNSVSVCSINSDTHVLKKCQPVSSTPHPRADVRHSRRRAPGLPTGRGFPREPAFQEYQPPLAQVPESVASPKLQSHFTAQTEKELFTFCSFSPGPNMVTADKPLILRTPESCAAGPQDPKVPGLHHPASRGTGRVTEPG